MKHLVLILTVILAACGGKQESYTKATDALDAAREHINACLQGDFSKAAFYALPDEKNTQLIHDQEKQYREKDKEGRQQFRTASINISEVKDLSDSITVIHYNNSFDKQPHTIQVVKRNNEWLVDLTKN
jgi:hypothetical protein